MPNLQKRASEKVLHPHAQIAVENYIADFADTLVTQSKILATLNEADEVQSNHVNAARDVVLTGIHRTKRSSEAFIMIGSVLLGAFLQGFFTEYSHNRPGWMVIYVIVGLIGTVCTWLGFRK